MQNLEEKERRVFERLPVELSLKYFSFHSNKEYQAQITDSSADGIGLSTEERLPVGTLLEIWFSIPDTDRMLYTRGEVIWSKMIKTNKYRVGVKLEKTDLMGFSRILQSNKTD